MFWVLVLGFQVACASTVEVIAIFLTNRESEPWLQSYQAINSQHTKQFNSSEIK